MKQLEGRVAIITGAGSGIGRASAIHFAAEGARVVAADWNAESGAETEEIVRASGGEAAFCRADVSQAANAERMVRFAEERYGKLDALFNNAAVQILGRLTDTSEQDWDRIHSVNLKGVFLCMKYAIPAMIRAGGGAIVNMSSILGLVGDPDLAAYCAAKGGVIALTKAAALTCGENGIRVNCLCPGDVETPMVKDYFDKAADPDGLRKEVYSKYALRRIATPEEIARTAAFLVSDASSFMTGSVVVADGGLTSKCY
ncbi:MAG: glucose 1-dehydrogenase [Acidobacteria bacterium]|nr:glucose 1-dehydrogenase [Acidobacteriota bacterium]